MFVQRNFVDTNINNLFILDDDNRVTLKKLDHELCHGDYINASYIDVR